MLPIAFLLPFQPVAGLSPGIPCAILAGLLRTMSGAFPPKGQPPILSVETKKERLNMISALASQGEVRYMLYEGSMDQQRMIAFLRNMIRTSRQKIFLILDNLKVHHGNMVGEWVSRHQDKIGHGRKFCVGDIRQSQGWCCGNRAESGELSHGDHSFGSGPRYARRRRECRDTLPGILSPGEFAGDQPAAR